MLIFKRLRLFHNNASLSFSRGFKFSNSPERLIWASLVLCAGNVNKFNPIFCNFLNTRVLFITLPLFANFNFLLSQFQQNVTTKKDRTTDIQSYLQKTVQGRKKERKQESCFD